MPKPKPPRIDPAHIASVPEDARERLVAELYWRLRNKLDDGGVSPAYVAFEVLVSVLAARKGGINGQDLEKIFPVQEWRENQVSVPESVLRVLVSGWIEWQGQDFSGTFAQAMGLEGASNQGVESMARRHRNTMLARKRAADVVTRYTDIGLNDLRSQEDVIAEVAEDYGVSPKTIQRAYKKFGDEIRAAVSQEKVRQDMTSKKSRE